MSDTEAKTTGPLNLPMQPTGSGVADLEIAREQDALAADQVDAQIPTIGGRDEEDSEAQPS